MAIDKEILKGLIDTRDTLNRRYTLARLQACYGAEDGLAYYNAAYGADGKKNTAEMPQNNVHNNLDNDTTKAEINQDNLDALPSVDFRGISVDTYRHYGCSYNHSERRIVIQTILPDGTKSRVAVLTNSKRLELDDKGLKYAKVKAEENKARGIFNLDKIVPDQPVIVVEGEMDALSIAHCGYSNVIALGGQSVGNLIDWLNNNPAEYQFVILFDNDDSGKKAAPKAVNDLLRAGYKAVSNFISNDALKVDANDILTAQGADELKSRIDNIVDNAKAELQNVTFPPPKTPAEKPPTSKNHSPLPVDEIKRILEIIPVESLSYDDWALTVGSGLVDWGKSIKDLDIAFTLFNDFSARDTRPKKYSEQDCMSQWNSLVKGIDKEKKRGIGSLIELAKNYGYVLPQNDIQSIFSDSRGFKIPRGYHMTRNCISVDVKDTQKIIATAPFYISAYYCKNTLPDNTYFADITTITNKGKVRTIRQIPKGDLADARQIAPLANFDLPFSSTNAKFIVDFISAFIAVNSNILQEIDLHKKLGWTDDNIFISPYDNKFAIDKDNALASHLRVKGDSAKWLSTVKQVYETSPIGRAIFSASLASLILPVIGCRAFVVYLRCKSKAGKSAAFKLAASAFGDSQILKSLNATVNSLEGVIADISPFPAIFDERQVAGMNFDISNFVYRIGNGQGRGRCNTDGTLKDIKQWKNITICNGEESLTENGKTQGIHTRTLELDFTGDKIMPDDLAQDIHIDFDSGKTFGHGAKIFLDNLRGACIENLKEMYKSLSKDFKNKYPDYVDDHCRYIAAISVADFLALKYLFNFDDTAAENSATKNAAKIFSLLQTQKELSDEEREKDFILNWVSGERLHFDGLQGYKEKLVTPIYGCTEPDGLLINISYLKEACKRAGYSYSKLKTDLINAGVFVKINGKDTYQKWIGTKCRVVKLSDEYVKIFPPTCT